MSPARPPARVLGGAVAVMLLLAAVAGCTEHEGPSAQQPGRPTASQLSEARRLVNPENTPGRLTDAEVDCVARSVVMNPDVDEIANDMAQIENKDLRELVMTDYLTCAYNFVLDLYMRFAPAGLNPSELACIRSKFTELTVKRLAEVIVEDPDAGYTGPLVIKTCESHSAGNPLEHGTIPDMGGGS
jgi:hypothetical protein